MLVPERLEGWLGRWSEDHPQANRMATPEAVTLTAENGDSVECAVPFPPMRVDEELPYAGLLDHALAERRVGVVLVRRGGYAVGVFEGRRLVASKVGSRYVQGRSAAGGWSQQRFARRRENQAKKLYGDAADVVVRVLLPYRDGMDAVVLGGDKQGAETVLADSRLSTLQELIANRRLADVPDPKESVLRQTPRQFRAVLVHLTSTDDPVP